MTAHAAISIDHGSPAGPVSKVVKLAMLYKRAYSLSDDFDLAPGPPGVAGKSLWLTVGQIGAAAMHEPPASIEDVMLQIALAANWCDLATSQCDEESFSRQMGLAIESALQNATRFLCATQADARIEGDALALLNELLAQAVRGGAEIAEGVA